MKRRLPTSAMMDVCVVISLFCGNALASDAHYAFKAGDNPAYEIDVRTELPTEIMTTMGYLIFRPDSADAAAAMTIHYAYGVKVFRTQTERGTQGVSYGTLTPMFKDPPTEGFGHNFTVDPSGNLSDDDGALTDARLEDSQGPAWQLLIQPLPPSGQSSWSVQRQLNLVTEKSSNEPGPFGHRTVTRVETPAQESATYTVMADQSTVLTVQRKYDLSSLEKVGDTPVFHISGDGHYDFDKASGRVARLEWDLAEYVNEKKRFGQGADNGHRTIARVGRASEDQERLCESS
jgi:hypothetical protein